MASEWGKSLQLVEGGPFAREVPIDGSLGRLFIREEHSDSATDTASRL